jgi:uncharacterized protein involved in cysteine biosynthesis
MNLLTPIIAPFKGLQLCLTDPEVRRASLLPWLVGGIIAFLVSGILIYAFPMLTDYMTNNITESLSIGSHVIAWIASTLLSILAAALVTMIVVLVLCSYYHYRIAQIILSKRGFKLKELTALKELGRSSTTEILKLVWLVPLYIVIFVIGLIPIFTPFAFFGWGMLAAYQFLDYPLDTLHYGAFDRLGFVFKHLLGAILFGVTLVLLSAIPFVIFFITPVAVAGASWLIVEMGWVKRESE